MDSEVGRYSEQIGAAGAQLDELQVSIEASGQSLEELKQQLADRQQVLEKRLLSAYKSDDIGYLEVVMGAEDFTDFLNRVDMINTIAEEDSRLINSIRDSQQQVEDDISSLEAQKAEQAALAEELGIAQQELLTSQAEQQSVVASIQNQRDLNETQLSELYTQAAEIEEKMAQIQQETMAASSSSDFVSSPPPTGGTSYSMSATAYCLEGNTATGMPVGRGIIAVDPSVIPLGTSVHVSGYGDAIAADTGGAIIGNHIDVWLPCGEAYAWGTRTVTVTVY